MGIEKTLVIGYGGTLNSHSPKDFNNNQRIFKRIKDWVWTYNPDLIDQSSRSGFFLLKGLELLKNKYPEKSKFIKILLWGNIDSEHLKQIRKFGIEDLVSIKGFIHKAENFLALNECDIFFLPLESSKNNQEPLFIPGKLYELLNLGKPIFALMEESDCKEIIRNSGLGIFASPKSPEDIMQKLIFCIENKEKLETIYKPNIDYINSFSFKVLTQKLSEIFDDILKN